MLFFSDDGSIVKYNQLDVRNKNCCNTINRWGILLRDCLLVEILRLVAIDDFLKATGLPISPRRTRFQNYLKRNCCSSFHPDASGRMDTLELWGHRCLTNFRAIIRSVDRFVSEPISLITLLFVFSQPYPAVRGKQRKISLFILFVDP